MKPTYIRIENYSLQMGITKNPIISWKYEDVDFGQYQKKVRVFIFKDNKKVYDSDWLDTAEQKHYCEKLHLKSHNKYKIHVEVINDREEKEEGESCFVSGICEDKDWVGKWISEKSELPQYVGTDLRIIKKIKDAYISVSGVGQYELKVNGRLPDQSVLNGSWTDFDKHIHYRTFDITKCLKEGQNEIKIELGNGWYHAVKDQRHFYTYDKGYRSFGRYLSAIAVITLRYEDETTERFGTDETWWGSDSETIYTNIYGSEDYDGSKEELNRKPVSVLDDKEKPKGGLIPMQYPPVHISAVYEGRVIAETPNGVLYDMGQNMSALFEITVQGKRGEKIRITPVEKIDTMQQPVKTVETWCTYILSGKGIETWHPKFTFGAGRYLYIETEKTDDIRTSVKILSARALKITSAAENTGEFYCSDYRYMQIYDLVVNAIESNLNHVHTDCPTIERLGWQEPNHLMAPSIMYVKNVNTLWNKILMDQRDSQYEKGEEDIDTGAFSHRYEEGLVTSIAPRYAKFTYDSGEGSFWDIIPWGSSLLMAPEEQKRFYGRCDLTKENYDHAKKYVMYQYRKYLDFPRIYQINKDIHFIRHGLGDWGIRQNKGECRENIETAYLYKDVQLLADMAQALGEEAESISFRQIAERIKGEYNQNLLVQDQEDGEWYYRAYDREELFKTQANQAIPLQFGMVPEDKRKSVEKSFLKCCENHILRTGEIGLPYILRTLGELGKADIVHEMITRKEHPSYYRFVMTGETTLPEFWRDDARSRNHDMMGAVLEWFYRYLAGISSEDGYRTITICPNLPKKIEMVKCKYHVETGEISVVVWKDVKGILCVDAKIPVNTHGTIKINENQYRIEGGKHYKFL